MVRSDSTTDEPIVKAMREATSKFDVEYWRSICGRGAFPSEYWKALGSAGLFGVLVEKEWGGMGSGLVDLTLATLETAEHHAGLGSYLYLSGALTPSIFMATADESMKRRMLPSLARGEKRISIALTEEDSGLDALSMGTTARKSSDHFVIDGTKMFVTNADTADFLLIFARTKPVEEEKREKGISMFLVNAKSPGIRAEKLEKLGMDFNALCSLEIKDLKAGSEDLVGPMDEAWRPMKEVFQKDRILTSASLVGTGMLALDLASAYAGRRRVFGKAVGSNQGIQFPLADALAQLVAAESITLKAATMVQNGENAANQANIALIEAQTAAASATDRALQAFGGHGYLKRNDVERFWRDVRVHRFHPISEEVLLSLLATKALGLPASY
jgi:acyl-CoA dehydrogenase